MRRPNRWLILGLGLIAQATTTMLLYGLPTLVPTIRRTDHLSLVAVGWVVAAPTIGLMLTLIAWGAAADRYGERDVMAIGLVGAGGLLVVAALVHPIVYRALFLALAGASGASVNAASGRVVLGWFAPHERGTAMGARQTAQPLGVGLAALILPPLAGADRLGPAIGFLAGVHLVVGILARLFVVDPQREATGATAATASPYRTSSALLRLHASSTLLVVPQFAVSVFAVEFLVSQRHWTPIAAGRLLFAAQLLGAAGRLAAGRWSDIARSRLGPMRKVSTLR